jgi:predicted transcriptional regulator of viral defense system
LLNQHIYYTFTSVDRPKSSQRRTLARLAREARGGLVSVARAAEALRMPRPRAAQRLSALVRRGWLARVRQGLYLVLPLEALPGTPSSAEDPWVVAAEAFAPCYIGGWSAAEHWEFTEQIFRSTFVVTAASLRHRRQTLLGADFQLVSAPTHRVRSVAPNVWRARVRVAVSNPARTIADALASPDWVGGVRPLTHVLRSYRESRHFRSAELLRELEGLGRGAAWKRLGYLAETLWPEDADIAARAHFHRSAGVIRLDPAIPSRGRLNKRWGLWVNTRVGSEHDA